jgi:nitrite reductase/ring-hydroxylating ferredoxin subunit
MSSDTVLDQITRPPDGRPPEEQPQWRQDFPIDKHVEHYVTRREFTKFMVLTSVAFVVGQFWIALKAVFSRSDAPPTLKIASLIDLQVGGSLTFDYPEAGKACILVRTGEREAVAFSQLCTHLSCPVIPEVEKGRFHCPCHNGNFELMSGRPLYGPPQRPLPRVRLQIRDGHIFAVGMEDSLA